MQGAVNPAGCHHARLAIVEAVIFNFNGGFPFEAIDGIERDLMLARLAAALSSSMRT
jgi:hypothetical protein